MRHRSARPLLALVVALLCGITASACGPVAASGGPGSAGSADTTASRAPKAPNAPRITVPNTSADTRIVLIEPPAQTQVSRKALLAGRFGFVGNTCLALVVDDGGTFLVRMPAGTRVEKAGDDWRVFTPGGDAAGIVVGDRVRGGGGHLYGADASELDDVPPACRGVGLAQFAVEK